MRALVVFGSSSDAKVYDRIVENLADADLKICSAHRTPELLERLLVKNGYDVVIAGAGLAAHLPGVTAANVIKPVIGVPVKSNFDGLDALLAILQMPPDIPVLTVGVDCGKNAAAFVSALTKKQSVNIVNLAGTDATKAITTCCKQLDGFGIPYSKSEEERESVVNIVMLPLNASTPEPKHLSIFVPIKPETAAADATALLELTKNGVWVGMNRGENAAIAAVQLMNIDGEHTEKLLMHRKKMQHKIFKENKKTTTTYADAGVSIEEGNEAVARMKSHVKSTFTDSVLADIGLFGGLYHLEKSKYTDPVLVASSDGVGTKIKVASLTGIYDTVGQDLVNHCANDILTQGATPLFFLDYIAAAQLRPNIVAEIVKGLSIACKENGCALIGGETAEMPGVYRPNECDIASFIVGIVEKDNITDRKKIADGDVVIGLPSNGLHTNGYSLVIKVLLEDEGMLLGDAVPELGCTLQEELLRIHKSYVDSVSATFGTGSIKSMAHITGGGLTENIPRIMPEGLGVHLKKNSWKVPPIFTLIQKKGNVADDEMYRVFNMGIGYVIITDEENQNDIMDRLKKNGEQPIVIGSIIQGNGVTFT